MLPLWAKRLNIVRLFVVKLQGEAQLAFKVIRNMGSGLRLRELSILGSDANGVRRLQSLTGACC